MIENLLHTHYHAEIPGYDVGSRDIASYRTDVTDYTDESDSDKSCTAEENFISNSRKYNNEVFIHHLKEPLANFIRDHVDSGKENASFLVTNLGTLVKQFKQWRNELPMVEPFYAVKCCPDIAVVQTLASLGCNFDCATMGEINMVLNELGEDLNFSNNRRAATSIVFANPAKMESHINFAIENNVRMTVFDGEDELYKIASCAGCENLQLLLRLSTDDSSSVCQFSNKYGCPVTEAKELLQIAYSLGLNVAGVCFHVGSGCGDAQAYKTAFEHSKIVFSEALKLGMPPLHIVDIGGGFPGAEGEYGSGMPSFQDLCSVIRDSIVDFKSSLPASTRDIIRFIAEPGRYFVSASTVVATKVFARKGGRKKDYQVLYVDDGVYGSFNNVVYDHFEPVPLKLNNVVEMHKRKSRSAFLMEEEELNKTIDSNGDEVCMPTSIFGPTCDGLDQMCCMSTTKLPRCEIGDWLIWENFGAYTHTASYVFNGYTHIPQRRYVFSM